MSDPDAWDPSGEAPPEAPPPDPFTVEVLRIIASRKIQTPRGVIALPMNVPFPSVPNGRRCPKCKLPKLGPRPHQAGQHFCFGCGHIEDS